MSGIDGPDAADVTGRSGEDTAPHGDEDEAWLRQRLEEYEELLEYLRVH